MNAVLETWREGGPLLLPLAVVSVAIWWLYLRQQAELARALRAPRGGEQALARARRDLLLLRAFTAAAPLLGLLGTVVGMVRTFDSVSGASGEGFAGVAHGVGTALVTTQFGLVVALPGVFGVVRVAGMCRAPAGAVGVDGMKRLQALDEAVGAEVNLSPLIDVVFLLLIFFMVTTVFVDDAGVEVEKPTAATAAATDPRSIRVALTADGRIVSGGRSLARNDLRGALSRQAAGEERPVLILADRQARTGLLMEVIGRVPGPGSALLRRGGGGGPMKLLIALAATAFALRARAPRREPAVRVASRRGHWRPGRWRRCGFPNRPSRRRRKRPRHRNRSAGRGPSWWPRHRSPRRRARPHPSRFPFIWTCCGPMSPAPWRWDSRWLRRRPPRRWIWRSTNSRRWMSRPGSSPERRLAIRTKRGARGVGGSLRVKFVVDEAGLVRDPVVLERGPGTGSDFDQACLEAVRRWRFRPGTLRGRPVPVYVIAPFSFEP